jgi:hypothetical protein
MRRVVTAAIALCISLVIGGACRAQSTAARSSGSAEMVKEEPPEGKMYPYQVLLVDDGTCGRGRIKEVIGGEINPAMNPRPRSRRCITKPAK